MLFRSNAWQGRYTLALTYGVPLISSWAITLKPSRTQTAERVLAVVMGGAIGIINAVSLVHAWDTFGQPHWPLHGGFPAPPSWLVVGLACVAVALMALAAERLAQRVCVSSSEQSALR